MRVSGDAIQNQLPLKLGIQAGGAYGDGDADGDGDVADFNK